MNEIKFGPSGNDSYCQSMKYSTCQTAEYVKSLGLDCFEYSFGKGVRLSQETALKICDAFRENNIEISVHAPYFINFSNPDQQKIINSEGYLTDSLNALLLLGGKRVVFHPGARMKLEREEAFSNLKNNLERYIGKIESIPQYKNILICPETMGKVNQMGTVEEIASLCTLSEMLYPCIDFGHVNAREQGSLKVKDDFKKVIDTLSTYLPDHKIKNMHVHYSKIEYSSMGEVRHLNNCDTTFGPEFEPFAEIIVEMGLTPYIVSESAGNQGMDAKEMKSIYLQLRDKR